MIGIAALPERWIRKGTPFMYLFTLLLLFAVLLFGKVVYGAKSWLVIGPISLQPSEIAKIGAILAVAFHNSRSFTDLGTLRDVLTAIGLYAIPVGLVMLEPDFGSATVFLVSLVGIALWSGVDLFLLYSVVTPPIVALVAFFGEVPFYIAATTVSAGAIAFRRNIIVTVLLVGVIVGAGFSPNIIFSIVKPHQKDRIETFLDPNNDPRGKGYHVLQSTMAVGSGGITGKGFLKGTQTQLRYIPKQWTDFIFCVPTEEFGFIGGTLVISVMGMLIFRAIHIAEHARTKFASTVAIGIASIWSYHTLVNIGMAVGLMPVMGIPLPFLSAGGSSLVVNMMMVGMLLNFYRHHLVR
jgi:rod shape determining protein RodA